MMRTGKYKKFPIIGTAVRAPWNKLLVIGNVLFPIGKAGLQDKLTPMVGLDYSF